MNNLKYFLKIFIFWLIYFFVNRLFFIANYFEAFSQVSNDNISLLLSGLALQIAFQVLVNIGVSINLLPTKGTILPLISYGGSSFIATSAMMGMILLYSRTSYGRML